MRNVIKAALTTFIIALAAPVTAQDFERGREAYERGDYVSALREFLPLAEQGVAEAQYHLAVMYEFGRGLPLDYAEAVKWHRKAADQGYAMAQNDLGVLYAKGQGVPQDDVKAAKWYEKAAAQGIIRALNNLGLAYVMGQGVPQNDAMGLKLFTLAAESGDGGARSNIGNMYAFGRGGLEQDYIQALMWFNLAAYAFEANNERDMTVREMNDKNRELGASFLTPAQIAEAENLARDWKPK